MHQPLISIIITVLNGAKTIQQTLQSISGQKYSDFELVIIDGGSTDGTVEIIESIYLTNKILRVIPGIGLYAGLNTGVKESSGKWLYFMGADDMLRDSDTLNDVAEKIKEKYSDTMVIVGNVECVKQENILKPMFGSPYWMRHQVHHQGMFYDRNLFSNMSYNEGMRIASDYEFNLKLALMNVPHQAMDVTVCNFGGDGISENQLKKGYSEMQQAHKRLFKGLSRYWVMNYFWLRRSTGSILRRYDLLSLRSWLKSTFG